MKELSEQEFNTFEEEFYSKQNEYFNKFIDLDKEYSDDNDFEEAMKPYREIYKEYLNGFDHPEYCLVTKNHIDSLENNNSPSARWLKEKFSWIGKSVKVDIKNCPLQGTLIGIARTLEDYYYLIATNNGKVVWETAVSQIILN